MKKKIGRNEQSVLNKALKYVRKYKINKKNKNKNETYLNNLLMDHLLQADLPIKDRRIHPAKFVGETFRPECYLKGAGKIPLCAMECKKLTEDTAKDRWKAGLSQALLYSHFYKAVILIFYDFTKQRKYYSIFSKKRSTEASFVNDLRKSFRVHVIVIPAEQ